MFYKFSSIKKCEELKSSRFAPSWFFAEPYYYRTGYFFSIPPQRNPNHEQKIDARKPGVFSHSERLRFFISYGCSDRANMDSLIQRAYLEKSGGRRRAEANGLSLKESNRLRSSRAFHFRWREITPSSFSNAVVILDCSGTYDPTPIDPSRCMLIASKSPSAARRTTAPNSVVKGVGWGG